MSRECLCRVSGRFPVAVDPFSHIANLRLHGRRATRIRPHSGAFDAENAAAIQPYRVSHPAKASQPDVPETMSRIGCDATIRSPPQMVAG